MLETINLELEIIEAPKGVFTTEIKNVKGAVAQAYDKNTAIQEAFKSAYIAMRLDKSNFKS